MTQHFRKLSHSLYECKYHIIVCPKYRFRVLRGELADYIRREIYSLLGQKEGVEVLEANVQADHIHLVLWIPPKYAVSNIMGFLKGKLAIRVFNRYAQLRKRYYSKHLWARGYSNAIVIQIKNFIGQAFACLQQECHQNRITLLWRFADKGLAAGMARNIDFQQMVDVVDLSYRQMHWVNNWYARQEILCFATILANLLHRRDIL